MAAAADQVSRSVTVILKHHPNRTGPPSCLPSPLPPSQCIAYPSIRCPSQKQIEDKDWQHHVLSTYTYCLSYKPGHESKSAVTNGDRGPQTMIKLRESAGFCSAQSLLQQGRSWNGLKAGRCCRRCHDMPGHASDPHLRQAAQYLAVWQCCWSLKDDTSWTLSASERKEKEKRTARCPGDRPVSLS